jgi:Protein of unknown function (DUF3037)
MPGLRQCEFFLIQYRPDPARGEYLNIGVLLREVVSPESRGASETRLHFTRDWRRVRCLDQDADISRLELLEADLRRLLENSEEGARPFIDVMINSWSNDLTLSDSTACLAENLPAKVDRLMEIFVHARKREPSLRKSRRQVIYEAMRTHFERAGVWDLMRKRIAVADYLGRADTLRIDCGYRNGRVRMFHSVALDELDAAKVLAFTSARLAAGVRQREGLELELTAVVDPLPRNGADGALELNDEQFSIYNAGKSIMQENGIQVITTLSLPQMAEAARRELRV